MLILHIEAKSIDELRELVIEAFREQDVVKTDETQPEHNPAGPGRPVGSKDKAPRAKRGGKNAEQAPAALGTEPGTAPIKPNAAAAPATAAPVSAPATTFEAIEQTPPATQEEAKEALSALFEKQGLTVSLNVLSRFGAKRIVDLKPEQYGALVAAAKRACETGVA